MTRCRFSENCKMPIVVAVIGILWIISASGMILLSSADLLHTQQEHIAPSLGRLESIDGYGSAEES